MATDTTNISTGSIVHEGDVEQGHPTQSNAAPVQVQVPQGQNVVRIQVTPGETIQLPFPTDGLVARLGDNGNLAVKVGDITIILVGYADATGQGDITIVGNDGRSVDVAAVLASTDPNLDIQTAAGPGAGVTAAKAVLYSYIGAALGDFACGLLSQKLRSRKRALYLSLLAVLLGILLYLHAAGISTAGFYLVCFLVGLTTGYWAVLITAAAEHFGTNLRATVATSVPNLVRAGVIPISLGFQWLHPRLGLVRTAAVLGVALVALAFIALAGLRETYGRDLDFQES